MKIKLRNGKEIDLLFKCGRCCNGDFDYVDDVDFKQQKTTEVETPIIILDGCGTCVSVLNNTLSEIEDIVDTLITLTDKEKWDNEEIKGLLLDIKKKL